MGSATSMPLDMELGNLEDLLVKGKEGKGMGKNVVEVGAGT